MTTNESPSTTTRATPIWDHLFPSGKIKAQLTRVDDVGKLSQGAIQLISISSALFLQHIVQNAAAAAATTNATMTTTTTTATTTETHNQMLTSKTFRMLVQRMFEIIWATFKKCPLQREENERILQFERNSPTWTLPHRIK